MADIAVIGAGMAGMATAARLQAHGFSTLLLEAHGQAGGCAGFYRRRGFSFDVGATTLVDFEEGGVGGQFLAEIGMPPLIGEALPGYMAWLPDRTVTLYRNQARWSEERLAKLGDTPAHQALWSLFDQLAAVFWEASRRGIKLPIQRFEDIFRNIQALGWSNLPLMRYLNWSMGDILQHWDLRGEKPLVGLLAMLIEDTVHSTVDEAPLLNAALGITIRGAGLTRHAGGMRGFWEKLVAHYRALGGELKVGCRVDRIEPSVSGYILHTQRGIFEARQVVSSLPAPLTAQIAPAAVSRALHPYLERDKQSLGGAIVVFLGVPEEEVADQEFTHHQLLQAYDHLLGYGNNMFISVSAAGDTASAPAGHRAVMISTHCDLKMWQGLSEGEYQAYKLSLGNCLVEYARRVYPHLGENALVYEIATPRTFEKFTRRPDGAVGGVRQTLQNTNQHAIPQDIGVKGFWMVGDTTFPGLGTVACVLGSRLAAEGIRSQQ